MSYDPMTGMVVEKHGSDVDVSSGGDIYCGSSTLPAGTPVSFEGNRQSKHARNIASLQFSARASQLFASLFALANAPEDEALRALEKVVIQAKTNSSGTGGKIVTSDVMGQLDGAS